MNIHLGEFLSITYNQEKSRFTQFWTQSPNSIESFKSEMLLYTHLYIKHRPKQSLWLQKNFKLALDTNTQDWIEQHINIPCKAYGNEKLAFVVSKDVLAHIEVINSFEEHNSCIIPKHFASKSEAIFWLEEGAIYTQNNYNMSIEFEGVDENGFGIIKFRSPSSDIIKTFDALKNMIATNEYIKNNLNKYISLTKREKEIIHLYNTIHGQNELADKLCISLHTMRTHWKNIKNKLHVHSSEELLLFAKAFDTIHSRE